MRTYNDGKSEEAILQNEFTAYLMVAIKRHRINYLKRKDKETHLELPVDLYEVNLHISIDADIMESFSLLERIENPVLYHALTQAKERERYIFLNRILEERSFSELSKELGISYKSATHIYYRFLQRIRKMMGGDKK